MIGSMKNYYEILGVEEESTQEEIRARWARLTKLYHPDVLQSPEVSDRIKDINEAYQVLKVYSTRLEYDLELTLRRSILRKAEERKKLRWRKIRLSLGLGVILIGVGSFLFFSKEPQDAPRSIKVKTSETAKVLEREAPKTLEKPDKLKKPEKTTGLEKSKKPIEAAKVNPREPVKVVVPEPAKVVESKKPEKVEKPERPKEPEKPVEVAKVIPREPVKVVVPEPAKVVEPEKRKEPEKPAPSREEEVKKFFSSYAARYNNRDVEGFLSFFSFRATQNQKYGMDSIKKIYSNFFEQSEELQYQIRNMQVEPNPNGLEVKARYELNQVLKAGGDKKVWRGQIRWVLVREEEGFKILSLDYQHQK
jgi:curved DNA-binding protein CbpA